jgi:hypothetical protein
MKKQNVYRIFSILLIGAVFLNMPPKLVVASDVASVEIMFVLDVSASMNQADPKKQAVDALRLGLDIAPAGARVFLLTVNDKIVSQSGWINADETTAKKRLKTILDQVTYVDYTDFPLGLSTALERFSADSVKRIIFLGDPAEGGFASSVPVAEDVIAGRFVDVTRRAITEGVAVDVLLVSGSGAGDDSFPYLRHLAENTGGRLIHFDANDSITESVAEILLADFSYNAQDISFANQDGQYQETDVVMPTEHVARARLLVTSAPEKFRLLYAGNTIVPAEQNGSYALYDFYRPARTGVKLVYEGNNANTVEYLDDIRVRLIADYMVSLKVSVEHEARQAEIAERDEGVPSLIQVSCLHLDLVDDESGNSVLNATFSKDAKITLDLFPPDGGETISLAPVFQEGSGLVAEWQPQVFGTYQISLLIQSDGVTFAPAVYSVEIADIRPAPVSESAWKLTERAALIFGICLIIGAVAFALVRKSKPIVMKEIFHTHTLSELAGKLDLFVVWARAGEYEIPSMTFHLNRLGDRCKVNVAEILSMCDISQTAFDSSGAEHIWLSARGNDSLTIKNNSVAVIKVAGGIVGTGESETLAYGQKCYIVFGQKTNELEIHFQKARDAAKPETRGNIRVYQTRT